MATTSLNDLPGELICLILQQVGSGKDLYAFLMRHSESHALMNCSEKETGRPTFERIDEMLKDEANSPGSICRPQSEKDSFATLFSIIMDLKSHKAQVKVGRPTEPAECLTLEPQT